MVASQVPRGSVVSVALLLAGLSVAGSTVAQLPLPEPVLPCQPVPVPVIGLACPAPDGLLEVFSSQMVSLGFVHGLDEPPAPAASEPKPGGEPMTHWPADVLYVERAPVCTSASGYRNVLIYAVPSDAENRYAELVPMLRSFVARANGFLHETGAALGRSADLKFECASGLVTVKQEVLDIPTGWADFGWVVDGLRDRGYTNRQVKHWIFYDDATVCGGCGVGSIRDDERLIADNFNNGIDPMYAVTFADLDRGDSTWLVMMHETGHNNGAVQHGAPHASGYNALQANGWHCNDGYDLMCYNDGGSTSAYTTDVCPIASVPAATPDAIDCNNDDYFHTNPPGGSYLASHWNWGSTLNRFLSFGSLTPTGCGTEASPIPLADGVVRTARPTPGVRGSCWYSITIGAGRPQLEVITDSASGADRDLSVYKDGALMCSDFALDSLGDCLLPTPAAGTWLISISNWAAVPFPFTVYATTLIGLPPVADFAFPPGAIPAQQVRFADLSNDPDGTIVEWFWNFGDGDFHAARNASHAFTAAGTYNVTLTVTDDDGNEDSVSKLVTVVAPGTVRGRLLWNGVPVRDGTMVFSTAAGALAETFTDATGSFELPLAPGRWTLAADLGLDTFRLARTATADVRVGRVTALNPTIAATFAAAKLQFSGATSGLEGVDVNVLDAAGVTYDLCTVDLPGAEALCAAGSDFLGGLVLGMDPGAYRFVATGDEILGEATASATLRVNTITTVNIPLRARYGTANPNLANRDVSEYSLEFSRSGEWVADCFVDVVQREALCDGDAQPLAYPRIRLEAGTYTVVASSEGMINIVNTRYVVNGGALAPLALSFRSTMATLEFAVTPADVTEPLFEIYAGPELVAECYVLDEAWTCDDLGDLGLLVPTRWFVRLPAGTYRVVGIGGEDFSNVNVASLRTTAGSIARVMANFVPVYATIIASVRPAIVTDYEFDILQSGLVLATCGVDPESGSWCETGAPLQTLVEAAICYTDLNGDGGYDSNEPIYLVLDGCFSVSAGAVRLTPYGGKTAGSRVVAADADFDDPTDLIAGSVDYFDADDSGGPSAGDTVYVDTDWGGWVSVGDLRLSPFGPKAAGTRVMASDPDLNLLLFGADYSADFAWMDSDDDRLPDVGEPIILDADASGDATAGDLRVSTDGGAVFGSILGSSSGRYEPLPGNGRFRTPALGSVSLAFRPGGDTEGGARPVTVGRVSLAAGRVANAAVTFAPNTAAITLSGPGSANAEVTLADGAGNVFEGLSDRRGRVTFSWVVAGDAELIVLGSTGSEGIWEGTLVNGANSLRVTLS